MRKHILITVMFLILNSGFAVSMETPDYFPPNRLSDDSDHWYSGHLNIMGQDSMFKQSMSTETHHYRYLLISVLGDPICLNININGDKAELNIIEMKPPVDGQKEYQRIVRKKQLKKEQLEVFLEILDEETFWKSGQSAQSLRFGGIQWVIEGARNGQYQVIERWASGEKDFPKAVNYLLEL